mmetsp:Transcript_7953/g.11887  ORF Transcript_7953/g.11887 Transcript_7953/m.11887 type:complete len:272 (+) Transcript_7953:14-829(+)
MMVSIVIVLVFAILHIRCNSYLIPISKTLRFNRFLKKDSPFLYHTKLAIESKEIYELDTTKCKVTFPNTIENLCLLFGRCSWISWWVQIILSVISGVILTFANTVRQSVDKGSNSLWASGFIFSASGVFIALLNALWTWNITRTTRRIVLRKINTNAILPTLKRLSKYSVLISIFGMFFTLLGAEQIVGTLASKVLSSQNFTPIIASTAQGVQALDIFLIQANTNALVAHFASLVCYLYLQTQLPRVKFISNDPTPTPTNTVPIVPEVDNK